MITNPEKVSRRDFERMTESRNYDSRNQAISDLYWSSNHTTRSLTERTGLGKSRIAEIVNQY